MEPEPRQAVLSFRIALVWRWQTRLLRDLSFKCKAREQ